MAVLMAERIERPRSLFGLAPEERSARSAAARRSGGDDGLSGRLTLDEAIVGM